MYLTRLSQSGRSSELVWWRGSLFHDTEAPTDIKYGINPLFFSPPIKTVHNKSHTRGFVEKKCGKASRESGWKKARHFNLERLIRIDFSFSHPFFLRAWTHFAFLQGIPSSIFSRMLRVVTERLLKCGRDLNQINFPLTFNISQILKRPEVEPGCAYQTLYKAFEKLACGCLQKPPPQQQSHSNPCEITNLLPFKVPNPQ